ncbi:MAG: trypsin-like peptidase domain-containing protein [Actinobacteria bacterium]|nr:trypsin-like peptidase domain-containing protein [Actinomycetota bacterium]
MPKKFFKILIFIIVFVFISSFTALIFADETTSSSKLPDDVANYQLTSADKVLLVEPSVCYITSIFYGYVLDPWTNQWSDYYYEAFGGTGFVVNPQTGHIVTAGHVLDINEAEFKYDLIYAYLMDAYGNAGQLDDWTDADWNWAYENIKVEGHEGPPYDLEVYVQFNTAVASQPEGPGKSSYLRAEVVSMSTFEQRDIGIIRITPQTGRALSSAIIGDSSMIEIQDPVTVIGYPWTSDIGQDNTLNPTVTNGTISGKQMVGGTEWIQIQGDVRPGNSGGPVLDKNGNVIGIVSAGTDTTNNYIRPSNDIKTLLNVENKLGMVDEEWKTGLVMFRLQHFSEAIKHFDAVLNLSAGHLLVMEYKAKAQSSMGQDKPLVQETTTVSQAETTIEQTTATPVTTKASSKLTTTVLILLIVIPLVLIIAIIVIVVLVVTRRRNQPPVQQPPIYQQPVPQQVTAKTEEEQPKGEKEEKPSEEKKEEVKFCANCGAKVEPNQVFCPNCGNKLK